MSLFRKEVLAHQENRLAGDVSLAQPLSIKLTVLILITVAIAVVIFLFTAQYSRKETVRGFLMPNKGVIKSYARQGGVIDTLYISDGDTVEKGQVLATIVIPQQMNHTTSSHSKQMQGVELSDQLSVQLKQQLTLLDEEIIQHQQLQQKELHNLNQRELALQLEKQAITAQQLFLNKKLALLEKQQNQFNDLHRQGYLSTLDNQRQEQALLDVRQEKQTLARALLQHSTERAKIEFNKQSIPEQYQLRINALKRQKADIENQLIQISSNYKYTIIASHTGTVTGIQIVEGETVNPNSPLLHILPKNSELVAELLLPTRSAGFVQTGDNARLRFDAFPYQRFGFIESEITRIDRALIAPNEVQLPIALQEPVYRLRAKLTKQQMQAYGQAFELKSGMLFEADIMLEQRTLIEWLFEPLFSLQGRVS